MLERSRRIAVGFESIHPGPQNFLHAYLPVRLSTVMVGLVHHIEASACSRPRTIR